MLESKRVGRTFVLMKSVGDKGVVFWLFSGLLIGGRYGDCGWFDPSDPFWIVHGAVESFHGDHSPFDHCRLDGNFPALSTNA